MNYIQLVDCDNGTYEINMMTHKIVMDIIKLLKSSGVFFHRETNRWRIPVTLFEDFKNKVKEFVTILDEGKTVSLPKLYYVKIHACENKTYAIELVTYKKMSEILESMKSKGVYYFKQTNNWRMPVELQEEFKIKIDTFGTILEPIIK